MTETEYVGVYCMLMKYTGTSFTSFLPCRSDFLHFLATKETQQFRSPSLNEHECVCALCDLASGDKEPWISSEQQAKMFRLWRAL